MQHEAVCLNKLERDNLEKYLETSHDKAAVI